MLAGVKGGRGRVNPGTRPCHGTSRALQQKHGDDHDQGIKVMLEQKTGRKEVLRRELPRQAVHDSHGRLPRQELCAWLTSAMNGKASGSARSVRRRQAWL